MEREVWEYLRSIDRRTRFLATKLQKQEELQKEVAETQKELNAISPDLERVRVILRRVRVVKRFIIWILSIALTAGITTVIKSDISYYFSPERTQTQRQEVHNAHHD